MQNNAFLVVSGKVLESAFPLDSLSELREGIERELGKRNLTLSRELATLCPERYITAPFFLRAGFETLATNDEDAQALATAAKIVFGPKPPDALVLCLQNEEQAPLLKTFEGRTRRILLRFVAPENDQGTSSELEREIEEIIEAKDALASAGLTWEDCKPWTVWNEQFERALGRFSVESVARTKSNAVNARAKTDRYEKFRKNATAWNAKLEDVLCKNWRQFPASGAIKVLEVDFPGIKDFYINNRNEFIKLLEKNISLIIDSKGNFKFQYDVGEEQGADDASSPDSESNIDETRPDDENAEEESAAKNNEFETLAKKADLMRSLCLWCAERMVLIEQMNIHREKIKKCDQHFFDELKKMNLNAWQTSSDYALKPEGYVAMGKCYEALRNAFILLTNVADGDENFNQSIHAIIARRAAKAICLVKTALVFYNVPPKWDQVQYSAYEIMVDYAKNVAKINIPYLKMSATLPINSNEEILREERLLVQELDALRQALGSWRELAYYVERISEKKETATADDESNDALEDWNNVVKIVTRLRLEHCVAYSSAVFRESLQPIFERVPEDIDATPEFGRVVQEIEIAKAREREREALLLSETSWTEDSTQRYSSALAVVRKRYAGHKIVFIGGARRRFVRDKIEEQFNVDLVWCETAGKESFETLTEYWRDESFQLFLICVPWCGRKQANEYEAFARELGKDVVRIKNGTDPGKIANEICESLKFDDDSSADDAREESQTRQTPWKKLLKPFAGWFDDSNEVKTNPNADDTL